MKKIIVPLAVLFSLSACAQSSHLDRFYAHYHPDGADGGLSPFLVTLQFHMKPKKDGDWTSKISSVRCWSVDSAQAASGEEWAALDRSLKDDHFEEWFTARKGRSRIELMSKGRKGVVEDVVCVIEGQEGSGLCFHLKGNFTDKDRESMEKSFEDKVN